MKITPEFLAKERKELMKLFPQFAEPLDVIPVEACEVPPGSICRLWWRPNQTWFVVLGANSRDSVTCCLPDGVLQGFISDAPMVIIAEPPANFADLVPRIEAFQRRVAELAWNGRRSESEATS